MTYVVTSELELDELLGSADVVADVVTSELVELLVGTTEELVETSEEVDEVLPAVVDAEELELGPDVEEVSDVGAEVELGDTETVVEVVVTPPLPPLEVAEVLDVTPGSPVSSAEHVGGGVGQTYTVLKTFTTTRSSARARLAGEVLPWTRPAKRAERLRNDWKE